MNKLGKNTFIFVLFTILFSCEYELEKEFFNEVQKPAFTKQIDLSLFPDNDTIVVFNQTEFVYSIETDGLEITEGVISLNGEVHDLNQTEEKFMLYPNSYPAGLHPFTISVFLRSGSGSVADYTWAEGYLIEKEWVLLIDGRESPQLSLSESITEDGYLKISWEKNEQYNFHSYEISSPDDIKHTIRDADSTFFVDSSYFGGEKTYTLEAKVITESRKEITSEIEVNDPFPTLNFSEEEGLDSVRVYWRKSKYNCNYELFRNSPYPDALLFKSMTDTSFNVQQYDIGRDQYFYLRVSPTYQNKGNDFISEGISGEYFLGNEVTRRYEYYTFNPLEKAVYISNYEDLEVYDVTTMNLLKTLPIEKFNYNGNLSSQINSSKIAALGYQNIYVFDGKELVDPVVIPYKYTGSSVDYFYLTNNNFLAMARYNQFDLISIKEKKVIATIKNEDYPNINKSGIISTSIDGRFVCIATENGINIFKIESGIVEKIYSDNRAYLSVVFDINNPNQFNLTLKNEAIFETRNVLDFSLVNKINLSVSGTVIRNVDPESGYILLTDYEYLYILDKVNSTVILKVKSENEFNSKLYGNKIFSNSGFWLDISKYLPL